MKTRLLEQLDLHVIGGDVGEIDHRGGAHTHGDGDSLGYLFVSRPVLDGLLDVALNTSLTLEGQTGRDGEVCGPLLSALRGAGGGDDPASAPARVVRSTVPR